MSKRVIKQMVLAAALTLGLTVPSMGGRPAAPGGGTRAKLPEAIKQAAIKAQQTHKAVLQAKLAHLQSIQVLLSAAQARVRDADLQPSQQGRSSPLPNPSEILTAVGFSSRVFDSTGGFSYTDRTEGMKVQNLGPPATDIKSGDRGREQANKLLLAVILLLNDQVQILKKELTNLPPTGVIRIPKLGFGLTQPHY